MRVSLELLLGFEYYTRFVLLTRGPLNLWEELLDSPSCILFHQRRYDFSSLIDRSSRFNNLTTHRYGLRLFIVIRLNDLLIRRQTSPSHATLWSSCSLNFAFFSLLMLPLANNPLRGCFLLTETWVRLELFIEFGNLLQAIIGGVIGT